MTKRILWSFTFLLLPLWLSSQTVSEKNLETISDDFTQSDCCVTLLTNINDNNRLTDFSLSANFPNPFNPNTTIQYQIPRSTHVTLTVFNILGQEKRTLVNTIQTTGIYTVSFQARGLPSGVYFYRIQTDDFMSTRKMTLLP